MTSRLRRLLAPMPRDVRVREDRDEPHRSLYFRVPKSPSTINFTFSPLVISGLCFASRLFRDQHPFSTPSGLPWQLMNSVFRYSRTLSLRLAYRKFHLQTQLGMPPKRKQPAVSSAASMRSPSAAKADLAPDAATSQLVTPEGRPSKTRRASSRLASSTTAGEGVEDCPGVIDGPSALFPSPDAEGNASFARPNGRKADQPKRNGAATDVAVVPSRQGKRGTTARNNAPIKEPQSPVNDTTVADPELAEEENVPPEELQEALGRPPPVNSGYLPLPWKGRLGYVGYCLLALACWEDALTESH